MCRLCLKVYAKEKEKDEEEQGSTYAGCETTLHVDREKGANRVLSTVKRLRKEG
jgi:hypothetical protein